MKKIYIATLTLLSLSSLYANDGVYKVCASCHGTNFEKSALGHSKIVRNLSEKEIYTALSGYKNGTYGGSFKGVMKNYANKIEDTKQAAHDVYSMTHKNTQKEVEIGKDGLPSTFEGKKKKCLAELEEINKCVKTSNTPTAMKKCKKMVLDIAEYVKKIDKIGCKCSTATGMHQLKL